MDKYIADALDWLAEQISDGDMTRADAISYMERERDDPQEDYIPEAAQRVIETLTKLN